MKKVWYTLAGGAAAALLFGFTQLPQTLGVYHAREYLGAVSGAACTWDATHDVGDCVNAAIIAANTAGGGVVVLPKGVMGVSTPIVSTYNNVGVMCNMPSGATSILAAPEVAQGCELKWIGASGGRMMSFSSPTGTTSLVGAEVKNIRFNGNGGLAKDGLYLSGVYGGYFRGLRFTGGFNGGSVINFDIPNVEAPMGDQYNRMLDIDVFNTGFTSHAMYLGFYQSATGLPANASLNTFVNIHLFTGTAPAGKGIWCHGCDNNLFQHTFVSTGGQNPIDFDVYAENGILFGANHNIFDHLGYLGGTTISRGTTSYPTCIPFNLSITGQCPWGNEMRSLDGSNATANPTVEPGSFLKWDFDYGLSVNRHAILAGDGLRPTQTLMENVGGTVVCGADSMVYGPSTLSYYCANNVPSLFFSNGNATPGQQSHFTSGLYGAAGAEDLQFSRLFGTGRYTFDVGVKASTSIEVGVGDGCTTLASPGSLCLNAGSTNGLELTDGVGDNWFIRLNPSSQLEIIRDGGAAAVTIDPTTNQVTATGPLRPGTSTVGNLPACNATSRYSIMAVTDQLGAPTYGGALTGGGALAVLAFCNASGAWEAH